MTTRNLFKKIITRVVLVLIFGMLSTVLEAAIADCGDVCGGTGGGTPRPPCTPGETQIGNCCCPN